MGAAEDAVAPHAGIDELDSRVLEFEREWWRHVGAKEEAIRLAFGFSAARYYQVLSRVIDKPEALRHDPILVGRLLRARDARTSARAARVLTRRPEPDRND